MNSGNGKTSDSRRLLLILQIIDKYVALSTP